MQVLHLRLVRHIAVILAIIQIRIPLNWLKMMEQQSVCIFQLKAIHKSQISKFEQLALKAYFCKHRKKEKRAFAILDI